MIVPGLVRRGRGIRVLIGLAYAAAAASGLPVLLPSPHSVIGLLALFSLLIGWAQFATS